MMVRADEIAVETKNENGQVSGGARGKIVRIYLPSDLFVSEISQIV